MHTLIVDDDPPTVKMITYLLKEENYTVTSAENGMVALELLEREKPDIVILDVMMPRMDGLEVCRKIREFSKVPIIMLSAKGQVLDKITALRTGADDYITKPFEPAELLARVNAILRRSTVSFTNGSPAKFSVGDVEIDTVERRARVRGRKPVYLTPTELRLLHCLMRNAGRTLTRDTLREQVWEYTYDGESNSIDVYIKRLRTKLEKNPTQPELLITVRGQGYRFAPPPPINRPSYQSRI